MHPTLSTLIDAGTGSNPVCQECRQKTPGLSRALGPWLLGSPVKQATKVLFVGKVARGDCIGEEVAPNFEDVSPFGEAFIFQSSWPYWAYTRDIIVAVFGSLEDGIPHVAFTNIIKCNNESTADTTTYFTKTSCIDSNQFIWKEIESQHPQRIVFYTANDYDEQIMRFMPSFADRFVDTIDTHVQIGQKWMPWWERIFYDSGGTEVLRFIRVGHPERKLRCDFVSAITNWLTKNEEAEQAAT